VPGGPVATDDALGAPLTAVERVALAGAVVAGVVLRFWTTSHLWLDEALTVNISRLPVGDIPAALRHDGHPPLYYFLLHGWMRVFGEGDTAVRSLSGLFAVLTLPLAWAVGRRFSRTTAWLFTAVLALSPFAIRYGTETRMYSLVMVLVLAGYLLVSRALERPRLPLLVGIAIVSGLLLLTHYWAMWLLAATMVVLLWRAWRGPAAARGTAVRVSIAVAAGGLLFLPWLGVMLDQSAHTGTPWADPVRPTRLVTDTVQDFGGGDFPEGQLLGWITAGLFVIGLCGRAVDGWRVELDVRTRPTVRREAAVVAVTMALALVAGYVTRTTYATRYASVFFPLVMLAAAIGIGRFAGRWPRDVIVASVLVLGLVGGAHNVVTDRTQLGPIGDVIRAEAQPGDVVLICPDQLGPATHRVVPSDVIQLSYPTLGDPSFVDWRDYADRNEAVDPAAVTDAALARAAAAHSVWYIESGGYKTFEGQCEAVEHLLGARLGAASTREVEDGAAYFEHATLLQFAGPRR
jgi:mannosyltransferase